MLPEPTPAERLDGLERDVLYLLTAGDQRIWTAGELERAMEDESAGDYVLGLHRGGLINRTSDGYVFASRPEVRAAEIIGR